jgi:hypothetical protein
MRRIGSHCARRAMMGQRRLKNQGVACLGVVLMGCLWIRIMNGIRGDIMDEVTYSIPQSKAKEIANLIINTRHPKVTFNPEFEIMKKEAMEKIDDGLYKLHHIMRKLEWDKED